jgi:hypothetical protein
MSGLIQVHVAAEELTARDLMDTWGSCFLRCAKTFPSALGKVRSKCFWQRIE